MQDLIITGNPATFRDEQDMTDETSDTALRIFQRHLTKVALGDADYESLTPWDAGSRALREVSALAVAGGWTAAQAERLEIAVGKLYGEILAETSVARMLHEVSRG